MSVVYSLFATVDISVYEMTIQVVISMGHITNENETYVFIFIEEGVRRSYSTPKFWGVKMVQ